MRFILTADWHLRGDRPRCRVDEDWIGTQRQAIQQVVKYADKEGVPIFNVGDIFNTPRVATEVVNMALDALKTCKQRIFILAGNHDLPYHSYDNVASSSYGILRHSYSEIGSDSAIVESGIHVGNPFGLDTPESPEDIVFTHQLVFPDDEARPFAEVGIIAAELAEIFPNARWIFTGDYHGKFVREVIRENGTPCTIVNPGCLIRQVADYMEYSPSCYLVDTVSRSVEELPIIDDAAMVTDLYLRDAEEKDTRLSAFLDRVASQVRVSLSFRDNLEAKLQTIESAAVKAETMSIINSVGEQK